MLTMDSSVIANVSKNSNIVLSSLNVYISIGLHSKKTSLFIDPSMESEFILAVLPTCTPCPTHPTFFGECCVHP